MINRAVTLTYFYLLLYIVLSTVVILYNKWVLSTKHYGFPYPITLTMIHMAFSGSVAFILVRVFKVVTPVGMTFKIYVSSVVPISALFASSLWFGNTAYLFISVAFIQMLKSLMPVATFLMAILCGTDKPRCDFFLNMVLVSIGVAISSYGEIHFNLAGTAFQVAGILAEALRLVLTQILLQKKGLTLNPLTSLYYIAPCSFLFLSIPWILLEKPEMNQATTKLNFDFWVFFTNALCALVLNFSVFLVIGRTGALTVRVAGVLKDWILIALSTLIFPDSKLTVLNVTGYGIALSGVVIYNYLKMKDSPPSDTTSEKQKLPTFKERKLERKASDVFDHSKDESGGMSSLLTTVDEEAPLVTSRLVHGRKQ
ncbi:hypothetical protein BDL97_02G105200 [Sphagnum fallax]|nr:hypothetical protein BDL97_02G105200 [Sphagnum fallax]KAH8970735.1 hypothetical protein BDL97_02G105200 [Sphagnum fallax]